MATHKIGRNVMATEKDDQLTLTIDLKAEGKTSASGKSKVIASTEGNVQFNGVKIGLNIYTPIS